MRSLSNSNKGQMGAYIAVIVFLFGFAIISIISYLILSSVFTAWNATGYVDATGLAMETNFLNSVLMADKIIVFIMLMLIVGVAITSYKLATAPVFFIVTFFMAAFLGFISYIFNYIFSQIISQTAFDTVRASFPLTILVCTNFHWISLAVIIVGSITLYAKKEQAQEGYVE